MTSISRRQALLALPAFATASKIFAQSKKSQLPVKQLSHVTMSVSDPKRSIEFYQTLFGLPIQSYQGPTDAAPPALRIGAGPQFIFFSGIRGGGKPGIDHFCMTTPNFTVDRVTGILGEHGVTKVDGAGAGIAGGPMKYRIRIRDERTGGSKEGTPEMYIGDPDGLAVQLQDTTYCGGSGPMGEVCLNPVIPAPSKGAIELVDFTHVGLLVSDVERSKSFYRDLFGVVPFLSITQGAPKISVFGLKARNFDPAKAAAAITAAGGSVTARADASLSCTDPDGIQLQIKQA